MEQTEVLARMWMECDPNRGGSDPDEIMVDAHGDLRGQPRWKWFVPRAEASLAYLVKHGLEIARSEAIMRGKEVV